MEQMNIGKRHRISIKDEIQSAHHGGIVVIILK